MLEMMKDHTRMIDAACMREVGTFNHAGTRRHVPLVDYTHENGRFMRGLSSLVTTCQCGEHALLDMYNHA